MNYFIMSKRLSEGYKPSDVKLFKKGRKVLDFNYVRIEVDGTS